MQSLSPLRLGLAGGTCTLLGVGLARFAYTPLIPALVDAHWFSVQAANYLGALNLLGYLIGAVAAHRATLIFGVRTVLAVCLAVTVVSFYGCTLDWGVVWYGIWRLGCGISGAALVVVGVPAALSRVAGNRRPGTAALVFSGLGLGIAASGTLVPWLITFGVAAVWLALAVLAMALAIWSWFGVWRHLTPLVSESAETPVNTKLPVAAIALVMVAYGLDAAGFVPHTLFWGDYIVHELGLGLVAGSAYWIVLGFGAVFGPFAAGLLARWLGFRAALALSLVVEALAVGLPFFSHITAALAVSSFLVGLLIPGTVTLTSGSLVELTPPARQQQIWGWATLSFALLQAAMAYGMSWGHGLLGSYQPLFAVSAGLLVCAALCASVAGVLRKHE